MREDKMRVVLLEPGQEAKIAEIDASLEGMQKAVGGGYIEAVYPFEEEVCMVCNEEGKLLGMPLNRAIRDTYDGIIDVIAGPCFICDCSGEDFASLSVEQLERYAKQFWLPEKFFRVGGEIWSVPYQPDSRQKPSLDEQILAAKEKMERGETSEGPGKFEPER